MLAIFVHVLFIYLFFLMTTLTQSPMALLNILQSTFIYVSGVQTTFPRCTLGSYISANGLTLTSLRIVQPIVLP